MPSCRPARRVAILGAGLSGLSLALRLLAVDGRPEIVLVDRRETFARDRTWCAWETEAWPIAASARHRFGAWRVRAGGRTALHSGGRIPYTCWSSDAVHGDALARLERAGGVTLRLGERVRSVDPVAGSVATDRGALDADLVIDALAAGSPLARGRAAEDPDPASGGSRTPGGLVQSFLGLEVETERPVFEPGVVDLMDFDALGPPRDDLVRFLYVLPFSPNRALVEDTTFGAGGLPAAERIASLSAHLAARDAGAWEVHHEERGALPMSTRDAAGSPWPARHGPRCWTAGRGAGALRPSSGYALARIQRHCARMAHAIVAGHPVPPPRPGGTIVDALDGVLLRAVAADPAAAPTWFRDMVARSPADGLARFMSDAGSIRDSCRIVAAAPVARFAAAAVPVPRRERAAAAPDPCQDDPSPVGRGSN